MTSRRTMDLNCDMGELPDAIADGTQESLMPWLTSVNIACGGHAGDDATMRATIQQALRWKLAIGAHPGYPDPANFGRLPMQLSDEAVADFVSHQVQNLARIAAELGTGITHVKPHGALYNQAANDPNLAAAIAEGVKRTKLDAVLVGFAGSAMLDAFRAAGFRAVGEAFADRRYESDGSLRSRNLPGALIEDADEAAAQALHIAAQGTVIAADGKEIRIEAETICIHGDTPGAATIAQAVAQALRHSGISLCAF
jgi:UPF0271 protein